MAFSLLEMVAARALDVRCLGGAQEWALACLKNRTYLGFGFFPQERPPPAWRDTRWHGFDENCTIAAGQIVAIESAWSGRQAQFADPDMGNDAVSQFGEYRKSLFSAP